MIAVALLAQIMVCAALFYLGSRAVITSWMWSRYSPRLAAFMDCAACTGFWYGAATAGATAGAGAAMPISGLFQDSAGGHLAAVFVTGLCAMVWTPIAAAVHQHSLLVLGSAIPDPAELSPSSGQDRTIS